MLVSIKNSFSVFAEFLIEDKKHSLSIVAFIALLCSYLNSIANFPAIGALFLVAYFVPNTVLTGRVFFAIEKLQIKLFLGSVLFLALVSVVGSLVYFAYDYSEPMMLLSLGVIALALAVLRKRRLPKNQGEKASHILIRVRDFLPVNFHVYEIIFLFFLLLSYLLLFVSRTGESLRTPWDAISPLFFVTYFLSISSLLLMIFSSNRKTWRLLLYTIAFTFLLPSIYTIVLKYPAELGPWLHVTFERYFAVFGRFISAPGQVEAATAGIHKDIAYIGYYQLIVTCSRFLQVDPLWVDKFITPVLYSIFVPITSYLIVTTMKPEAKKLGLLAAVFLTFSQHVVFLSVPPDKPETLALTFLLVLVLFWVVTWKNPSKSNFFAIIILTILTAIVHEYVGYYALFITGVGLYLYKLKPFGAERVQSVRPLRFRGLRIFGFCSVVLAFIVGFIFAPILFSMVSSPTLGYVASINPHVDFNVIVNVVFPTFWQNTNLPFLNQVFYGYLNNFTYVLYALILLGVVYGFRMNLSRNWLALMVSLIMLSFANMISVKFLIQFNSDSATEVYRFFYILNFTSFLLVGLGIGLLTKLRVQLPNKVSNNFSQSAKRLGKSVMKVLLVLLVGGLFVASLIGGFPRPDSSGPYKGVNLAYVSDYDIEAVQFIKEHVNVTALNYFIFTDLYTSCAVLSEFGFNQIHTPNGSYTIYSGKPFDAAPWQLWLEAVSKPSLHPFVSIANLTGAEKVFLVLSYRLGQNSLASLSEYYTKVLGAPVYEVAGKVCVFEFELANVHQTVVVNDAQAANDFWKISAVGVGSINVSLSDKAETRIEGNDSLMITIQNGTCERFTLSHKYSTNQNWADTNYIAISFYGSGSQNAFNFDIVAPDFNSSLVYHTSDKRAGWQEIVIPVDQLIVESGTPDLRSVNTIMLQFQKGFQPGCVLFVDEISLFSYVPN